MNRKCKTRIDLTIITLHIGCCESHHLPQMTHTIHVYNIYGQTPCLHTHHLPLAHNGDVSISSLAVCLPYTTIKPPTVNLHASTEDLSPHWCSWREDWACYYYYFYYLRSPNKKQSKEKRTKRLGGKQQTSVCAAYAEHVPFNSGMKSLISQLLATERLC